MNLLDDLNEAQAEAVAYTEGPCMVIAGAGAGKTRVLTYKIAYLIQHGMKPWNILALTFTNKAAKEMKERIAALIGYGDARYVRMGTFHSVFAQILRVEAKSIGYSSQYTIYDDADSRSLIKSIVKEMSLDDKTYKPASVLSRISMAKNNLVTADMYAGSAYAEVDAEHAQEHIKEIYAEYARRCKNANAMDFDDLLLNTYFLLKNDKDICGKYSEHFKYILVDEYQDTNYVQEQIVILLSQAHRNICVVGDDYQSIYAFRGANIDNILNFSKVFENARLFKLEQNYRSTQNIVGAANSLMKHNKRQIPKDVYSRNSEGDKIVYKATYSDREEASAVCRMIKDIMRSEKGQWSDFAILYRTNSQSRSFEDEMLKQNIPYRVYGGVSFYQRKEIKDVIAYFRLVCNTDDEEAFRRIINYPARGIGQTTLGKITSAAHDNNVSLWQAICSPDSYGVSISKATANKLDAFRQMIESFVKELHETDASTLANKIIIQTGIRKDIFTGSDADDLSRQENLQEFADSIKAFVSERQEEGNDNIFINDYLQDISLQTDIDNSNNDDGSRVTLMTVHSAKGLEFPTVFVVGLDDNIFPSQRSMDSTRAMEEERRLLYVAITRAERHCILTSAQNRYRYGKPEFFMPSRFLKDIDKKYLKEDSELAAAKNARYGARGIDEEFARFKSAVEKIKNGKTSTSTVRHSFTRLSTAETSDYKEENISEIKTKEGILHVGDNIEHMRFGIGTVTKITGSGDDAKATVDFRNSGSKQLLLKFARFKIM